MARKQPTPATSFQQGSETVTEYKCESLEATKVGDLIVCNLLVFSTGRTYTATGWTQRGSTASITGGQWATFTRIATEAGKKSYPIKISGTSVSGTWACTYARGCDQTTPVVGAETKVSTASTTVKWASVTPSPAGQMDFLVVMSVEEDTFTTPTGFTVQSGGTSLHHSFSREYTKSEATGETSTTQSKSTPYGSTRLILQGEEEEAGETIFSEGTLSGTIEVTGSLSESQEASEGTLSGEIPVTGTLTEQLEFSEVTSGEIPVTGSVTEAVEFAEQASGLIEVTGSLSELAEFTESASGSMLMIGTLSSETFETEGEEKRATYVLEPLGPFHRTSEEPTPAQLSLLTRFLNLFRRKT